MNRTGAARTVDRMRRRESLDGLRGLAALVVLIHHAMLTSAVFSQPAEGTSPLTYLLTYTPLRVLWEGKGAVYVFFVLSGVVLALAITGSKTFSWASYYPQRLVRLYIPVWAALALGIVWIQLVPRSSDVASTWLADRDLPLTPTRILDGMTLIDGHGGLVSPLWSLRWEILFSLLLPLFAWIGLRHARWRWPIGAASLAVIGVGVLNSDPWLTYLPIFLLGILVAASLPQLDAWSTRMTRPTAIALTLLAPVLLVAPWLVGPAVHPGPWGKALLQMTAVAGATLTVIVALTVPAVRAALTAPWMRWFGMISFSLYLVHEPVVIAFANLFGDDALLPAALLSVPASIALAWIFYRAVEMPSHRLAKWSGNVMRGVRMPHQPVNAPVPVLRPERAFS